MASLKKSTLRPRKNSNLVATINSPLKTQLASYLTSNLAPILRPGLKLLLAFSGGLDSRVLLELLAALRAGKNFNLSAMHVHHGLSPNANAWARFCSDTCAALHVPIEIVRVNVAKDSGPGVGGAGGKARHQALVN